MTWPILTRLGHKYRLTISFMSYDQIGVKGHVGVTGVKKVIFTKKSFKSNRLRSVITWLMYMIDLDPLYKSYGSRKSSGVIWGHWGQKFLFPKNAITRPCYIAWPYDSYMLISLRCSTYVMGSNVNLGSFGVTEVKTLFLHKTF